jgi:hypothetical protein
VDCYRLDGQELDNSFVEEYGPAFVDSFSHRDFILILSSPANCLRFFHHRVVLDDLLINIYRAFRS